MPLLSPRENSRTVNVYVPALLNVRMPSISPFENVKSDASPLSGALAVALATTPRMLPSATASLVVWSAGLSPKPNVSPSFQPRPTSVLRPWTGASVLTDVAAYVFVKMVSLPETSCGVSSALPASVTFS